MKNDIIDIIIDKNDIESHPIMQIQKVNNTGKKTFKLLKYIHKL